MLDANDAPIEQPQVEDIAQWVFGPDGLRDLQVLAYHVFLVRQAKYNLLPIRGIGHQTR